MTALHTAAGTYTGEAGFRMMPTDPFETRPGTATAAPAANGVGWLLHYTWGHPSDGTHAGTLLVGTPSDDGSVTAAWIDSWHQRPEVRAMVGAAVDGGVRLESDYDGWLWVIEALAHEGGGLRMLMINTVPAGLEGYDPGPYVVMDATWHPAES